MRIVRAIKIIGVEHLSRREVNDQLAELQPPGWWNFWRPHPVFTEKKLERGINQIQQLYQQEGYYQTLINQQISEKNDRVLITISIKEGRRVKVGQINFGLLESEETNGLKTELRRLITLQEGNWFNLEEYEKSKTKILEYLANSGYPRAKLTSRVFIYTQKNRARIQFTIQIGSFTQFGKIKLSGNKTISAQIILREITFREEEPFSMAKVIQSQTNIFNLNLFRSVLFDTIHLAEKSGPVDIHVLLKERKPRTVEAGFGYGTEDKFRLRLSFIYRNFFGSARELRSSFRFSSLTEEESLSLQQPYFPDPSSTSRWTLSRKVDKFISFQIVSLTNELRIENKFSSIFSGFISHKLDSSKVNQVSSETKKELNFEQESVYFLSSFQSGLTWDTSDSRLNPTGGYVASLYLEPSHEIIGSDVSYLKGTSEYKYYYPLLYQTIMAGRLVLGTIYPLNLNQRAVPLFKRFFSGGTYSIRGYGYQELGPSDEAGQPVGGNFLIEGNFEIRFPLVNRLWGVIFFDGGNVSLESWPDDSFELRYSTGAGLRYNTIVGPLRLDVGYPLNPEKEKDKQYRIHLSIGQAF